PDRRPSSTGSSDPQRRARPSRVAEADRHLRAEASVLVHQFSQSTWPARCAGHDFFWGRQIHKGRLTAKGANSAFRIQAYPPSRGKLPLLAGGSGGKDRPLPTPLYCRLRAGHNHGMSLVEPPLQPTSAPALPAAALAGGVLTIDLAAIEANWKRLAAMTLPVECAAVV